LHQDSGLAAAGDERVQGNRMESRTRRSQATAIEAELWVRAGAFKIPCVGDVLAPVARLTWLAQRVNRAARSGAGRVSVVKGFSRNAARERCNRAAATVVRNATRQNPTARRVPWAMPS
jgi:CTP:molybdopterin cytidylyltransferase MocA